MEWITHIECKLYQYNVGYMCVLLCQRRTSIKYREYVDNNASSETKAFAIDATKDWCQHLFYARRKHFVCIFVQHKINISFLWSGLQTRNLYVLSLVKKKSVFNKPVEIQGERKKNRQSRFLCIGSPLRNVYIKSVARTNKHKCVTFSFQWKSFRHKLCFVWASLFFLVLFLLVFYI